VVEPRVHGGDGAQPAAHTHTAEQLRRLVVGEPLRGVSVRRRLYLALMLAFVAMAPVIVLSLYYDGEVHRSLDRLETEASRAVTMVDALAPKAGASGAAPADARIAPLLTQLHRMDAARRDSLATVDRAERDVVTVLLLTLVAIVLLLFLLPRQVVSPLRRILNVVRRAAQGDYAAEVQMVGGDEVGQMARELNRLLDRVALERQEHETLLRTLRQDLELVGRGLPQAVCVVDKDLVVTYANTAFETLVGADGDLSGQSLTGWIHDDAFLRSVRKAFAGGSEEQVVRFVDHRGETHKHKMFTAAGRSPEGDIHRVALVLGKAGLLASAAPG